MCKPGGTRLQTVTELFEKFGLSEEYVKDSLDAATSFHNMFESLKLQATMTYESMNEEDQARLAEDHKRLASMRITSIRRESDERATMVDNLWKLLGTVRGRMVLGRYIDSLIEHGRCYPDSSVHEFLAFLRGGPNV